MFIYSYFWFQIPEFNIVGAAKFLKDVLIGFHHLWYLPGMKGTASVMILMENVNSFTLLTISIICFLFGVLIQYIAVVIIFLLQFI